MNRARQEVESFIDKYYLETLGVPDGYLGQCVSLIQVYIHERFDIPYAARGNAIDWAYTIKGAGIGKNVTKPEIGDIVVWGKEIGKFGHIGIYVEDNLIFDQNNGWVEPAMTCQMRPMLKPKPIAYIRMNPKPVIKPSPIIKPVEIIKPKPIIKPEIALPEDTETLDKAIKARKGGSSIVTQSLHHQ